MNFANVDYYVEPLPEYVKESRIMSVFGNLRAVPVIAMPMTDTGIIKIVVACFDRKFGVLELGDVKYVSKEDYLRMMVEDMNASTKKEKEIEQDSDTGGVKD
jgi:hypothetical protein